METYIAQNIQHSKFFELDTFSWGSCRPLNIIPRRFCEQKTHSLVTFCSRHYRTPFSHQSIRADVSYPLQDISVSNVVGKSPPSYASVLKNKTKEVVPYLNGRSIYLVGMMGCGKTTVGKILSELLGYSFFDSDTLVEQTLGHISVAEIFKLHGEGFFRDKESEVMGDLSLRHRLVVSTGGGVVVRSINWEYMRNGISVWLDVPLKALAQRIAAVGTNSRPLLHEDSDDIVAKTFSRLSDLWEERGEAYTNADARVSLECIANRIDSGDISKLTPPVIAIEVLDKIKNLFMNQAYEDW